MDNTYQIPEFPDGDHYWYLTWFGKVSLNQNDYLIEVDLVAINYLLYLQRPTSHASYIIKDSQGTSRATARINITLLGLLEIGSVWYKTKMVIPPTAKTGASRVRIKVNDCQEAVLSTIDREIDIPQKYYPYNVPKRHHQSPCVVIGPGRFTNLTQASPVVKIIIPASAIIRFFYSGSNSLLKEIFSGGIPRDEVYVHSKSRFDPETKEAFIQIRKRMLDSDAGYIGRIAFCPLAYARAIQVGQELQLAHQRSTEPFVKANLPLRGEAVLSLCGKYVKSSEGVDGTDGEWAFLVLSIIDTTCEYPYSKLWFDRDNNTEQTKDSLHYKETSPSWQKIPELPDVDIPISSTDSLSPQIDSTQLSGEIRTKFLSSPSIEKVKKHQQKVKTLGAHFKLPQLVSGISVSENPGSNDSSTVYGQIENTPSPDDVDWDDLSELVKELREIGLTCKYLTHTSGWQESDHPQNRASFKLTPQMPKSVQNWCKLKQQVGGKLRIRARQASLIKISSQNTAYYLIDCEARSTQRFSRGLVYIPSRLILTGTHLDRIMNNLAMVQGIWRKWRSPNDIYVQKQAFDHLRDDNASKLAKRLVAYIKRVEGR